MTFERSYPPLPVAVGSARHFVVRTCVDAGIPVEACETLALLASEVLTNAVIHGRSQFTVALTLGPHMVRVAVSDDDSRHPQRGAVDPAAIGGRGLHLVDALATRWGVEDHPHGKTIWFELPHPG